MTKSPIPLGRTSLPDLLLKEAEWTHEELQSCLQLIQRYRATYLAAMFATIGWLLGQLIQNGGATAVSSSLAVLRYREDIATVLCLIPLINSFFIVLILEAQFRLVSLARYRFVLGHELGARAPVWRWELWRETPEGSFRHWTNPSNFIFGVVALTIPTLSLWFGRPAARESDSALLGSAWIGSTLVFVATIAVTVYLAVTHRKTNHVARPIETRWSDLWPGGEGETPSDGGSQGSTTA